MAPSWQGTSLQQDLHPTRVTDLRGHLGGVLHIHEILLKSIDAGCVRADSLKLLVQQLSEVIPLLQQLLQPFLLLQA